MVPRLVIRAKLKATAGSTRTSCRNLMLRDETRYTGELPCVRVWVDMSCILSDISTHAHLYASVHSCKNVQGEWNQLLTIDISYSRFLEILDFFLGQLLPSNERFINTLYLSKCRRESLSKLLRVHLQSLVQQSEMQLLN